MDAQAAAEPEALSGAASSRRTLARRPLPEQLPRERDVHPGQTACACCGGARLRPLGEDVTETLERIPARWGVIQHVRERLSCNDCETIAQAPAPFHTIRRGRPEPPSRGDDGQVRPAPAAASPPITEQKTL